MTFNDEVNVVTIMIVTLTVGKIMGTIVETTKRMLTIKEMTPIAVTMVGLTTGQDRRSCGGGSPAHLGEHRDYGDGHTYE